MRSAGASLPAIRRPHRAELVNMSKNLYLKSCLHPRHALYPFYRTTSFSRRLARLRVAGRWMFSRFQRTRDHPLTRCLQAISDTKVDRRILPANEPDNYFPAALRVKKLTPALPGHPEVIFSKIIVRTLVVPVYRY